MRQLRYTVFQIIPAGLVSIQASLVIFEAENVVLFEGKRVTPRSEASGQSTLKMNKGQTSSIEFCLTKHSEIEVHKVWYSNDGECDLITVTVDNKMLGQVLSEPLSKGGEGWNIFKPSGPLNCIVYLSEGRLHLSFYVEKGDEYGVEIDKIVLLLHNDVDLSQTQNITQGSGVAEMTVTPLDTDLKSYLISYGLIIEFSLDGPSIGMMDSELGSNIKVLFRGVVNPVHLSMQYFGRWSKWSESVNKTYIQIKLVTHGTYRILSGEKEEETV
ncbi:hypothetical protein CHS0354_033403 [Potamilus streckersoni]|uniref:Uncharacterized protein n=1 Tax=Potamilus streckersoni TaxID=2493646 RepID=A0AAE0SRM5_9BIVA|nr:hypothetical protein CHS0354_033403 [Potamilus streckersoni]